MTIIIVRTKSQLGSGLA